MIKLSKIDQRTVDMIINLAKNGSYAGAQQLARSFIASAASDKISAKRRAALTEHITTILPTV